jgi:8-oxo-dGTP pyrophosphatase MutT (NUDIX family)
LNLISEEEKDMLLTHDFQDLWNKLWEFNKKNSNNEYKNSEAKFNILKKGYYTKKNEINIFINLEIIIQNSRKVYNYPEPEWGFPKGRRNLKEKNVDCAKREFEEETNFLPNDYHILNMNPLEEIYLSTNYSKYKHIYYISQINNANKKLGLDPDNINQKIEIGDINWYSFEDGSQKIRNYNIEKKNVFYTLHNTIRLTIINFKEILNNFLEFL